jgi:hypothetical protein
MADPLQNAQFLSALFSQAAAPLQRANEQKAQLTLMALKRQQQLQDQAGEDSLRRELTGMQIQGQKDVALESTARAERVAGEQTDRMIRHSDQQTKDQIERERRTAYAKYVMAGGDKPLESFDEGDKGISQINIELGKKAKETLRSKVVLGAKGVSARARRLRALVDDPSLEVEATKSATSVLAQQGSGDEVEQAIKMINAGDLNAGLKVLSSPNKAIFDAAKQRAITAARVSKYKDPNVISEIHGLHKDQDALSTLINSTPDLNAKDVEDFSSLLPNLDDELGIKQTQADLGKYFGAGGGGGGNKTPPPAQSAADSAYDEGGALQVLQSMTPGRGLLDALTRNAGYALGTPLQMFGGRRAVRSLGFDNVDTRINEDQATRLAALRNLTAFRAQPQPAVTTASLPGYFPQ